MKSRNAAASVSLHVDKKIDFEILTKMKLLLENGFLAGTGLLDCQVGLKFK